MISSNGSVVEFKKSDGSLYYHENDKTYVDPNTELLPISMMSTVQGNKEYFARYDIESVNCAIDKQERLEWPLTKSFLEYIQKGKITN